MNARSINIVVFTTLISLFAALAHAELLGCSTAAGAEDPRIYSEKVAKMSLAQLEREGELELSLDRKQIEQIAAQMTFANARGANNYGIYRAQYDGKTYFIKKLLIRYDFQSDRFRQEAVGAIVLGHSNVGPKAGVLVQAEKKTILIIMHEQPGVPVSSKFWDFRGLSDGDIKKEQDRLQLQMEADLETKFASFKEAKTAWNKVVRASPEIKNALKDHIRNAFEYGLQGADFEVRISTSSSRPVGIIDTTTVWVDHNPDEENAIVSELKWFQKTLYGE